MTLSFHTSHKAHHECSNFVQLRCSRRLPTPQQVSTVVCRLKGLITMVRLTERPQCSRRPGSSSECPDRSQAHAHNDHAGGLSGTVNAHTSGIRRSTPGLDAPRNADGSVRSLRPELELEGSPGFRSRSTSRECSRAPSPRRAAAETAPPSRAAAASSTVFLNVAGAAAAASLHSPFLCGKSVNDYQRIISGMPGMMQL